MSGCGCCAKKKILIVDDDPDIVEAMSLILETKGYQVASAADGAEGLKKAREFKPNLIILDVMMATDDEGFQVSYQLKSDAELCKIPVLMVTSVSEVTGFKYNPETDQEFLPVQGFIEKPIQPEVLLSRVAELLK